MEEKINFPSRQRNIDLYDPIIRTDQITLRTIHLVVTQQQDDRNRNQTEISKLNVQVRKLKLEYEEKHYRIDFDALNEKYSDSLQRE